MTIVGLDAEKATGVTNTELKTGKSGQVQYKLGDDWLDVPHGLNIKILDEEKSAPLGFYREEF